MFRGKHKYSKWLIGFLTLAVGLVIILAISAIRSGFISSLGTNIEHVFRNASDDKQVSSDLNKEHRTEQKVSIDVELPSYLTYVTSAHRSNAAPPSDLYIGEDTQNNLKLLYYRLEGSKATDEYSLFRIYPSNISIEAIVAEFERKPDRDILPRWFNNQPASVFPHSKKGLVSENLVFDPYAPEPAASDWLEIPADCLKYMGGDDCVFTIKTPNPYNLPSATLTQKTGPYEWYKGETPDEIYVTLDNQVYIKWAFGDGGYSSEEHTLWDPAENKLVSLGSVSGECAMLCIDTLTLPTTDSGVTKSYPSADTIELETDPFFGWSIHGEPLKDNCYSTDFYPTNIMDASAKWLIEYIYGCYNETIRGLSVWYELDPTTDTVQPISGVMPR